MTKRHNHYEAAFEAFLRERRVPYVAVDESRRSLLRAQREQATGEPTIKEPTAGDDSQQNAAPMGVNLTLKSLDFIVSPGGPSSWLVDVKGRRFPSGSKKQYWKNWSTRDELTSLAQWQDLFGGQFEGLLVFTYQVIGDLAPLPAEQLFEFRDNLYAFIGVRLDHYTCWARTLSPKWDTVAMPTARFRELARPIHELFQIGPPVAARATG